MRCIYVCMYVCHCVSCPSFLTHLHSPLLSLLGPLDGRSPVAMMSRLVLLLLAAHVAAAAIPTSPCHSAPAAQLPFCNASLARSARVEDVVSRLSLAEKASLLGNGAAAVPRIGLAAYQWWNEGLHGVANSPGREVVAALGSDAIAAITQAVVEWS